MKNFFKKSWWALKLFFTRIYYSNPSKKLKIIGVTGTNGKTTTATLLYKISTELGYKTGLIGTVENIIDLEVLPHDEKSPSTTPDSISLTKLFKKMVDAGCEYVFMEVSSHALDQGRVNGINFTGGIFTNLTHDHLDYHKNFQNYFLAKKKFFEMLPNTAFALSNMDEEHGNAILDKIKANKFFYGFEDLSGVGHPTIDFYGRILNLDFSGLKLDFNGEIISSKLLGKFNAYNLLSVWSASKLLNFDMTKVNKIIEKIEPPRGRFEHFLSKDGIIVIIDYAHTPDALEKVLLTIKEIKPDNGRIISVFGCGGDRDPLKRSKMGKIGASLSDIAIFTSDNPRNENPEKIIDNMKNDLTHEENQKVVTIADRRLAIEESVRLAIKGDIILCAGKGHENYQEIKGEKKHFDDIEEFRKVI
ncbi:MAG: UDP-N-acetylmuramoyl-L-alanyl-D-glutamate-2,6-diaminopimelate ligase [Candidatus Nomurabacteria bacterium GW2011_GWE1_32_28]|uniref:UDP-N-acetylmuramoyl-L-alanyl-D-glutamate--2,6-diaminopimelate ligase n=1 Tax=Candidatus Nomurabacteria bacterium GW2011_GWF1_31_48 TaxID=1618767 RepID=A0A0F9YW08_9BACT|nr:MAG: UDP-N-acetylmuramoyl-L-alanyl-D-glutamate-2,6-diaminopimelate ligase [Candidatus Nomurabacteria bacterium GW2011_GWF2_30_133]KKP28883.1 MAG: UDP-N-acetylmuramoyl-L-alanyl-D-glutamate-2,6-diaminopimelate ligase [Candidatus Nomurabacteria bacterium GW2011_GWE2_31_40]KKP30621.1 MAG: UDP-N-acetylmuramoyl-L-alanyl-D-glutamate-2,6-diaminopimelate ligase [Candidatus Nomurabacteria bacterium GW2011_GWF1_31_48]KKP35139.1 MAG: UDP-N-acetylmuramoyl-L-alanyl-D-glutamate-2,6-diaminopimelate ligase [C